MALEDEIKSALAHGTLIIGTREVLRAVKAGHVKQVVLASNSPGSLSRDVNHYTKLGGIKVEQFNGTGSQLGTFLGKPFGISVLAIKTEGKK